MNAFKNYIKTTNPLIIFFLIINLISGCGGGDSDKTESAAVTPLFSPDGKIPSFDRIEPKIQQILIDDDPNSTISATLIFQPDDHGIEKIVLFGPKVGSGGAVDFAVVHQAESDVTAFLDIDSSGRISSISAGNMDLKFNYIGTDLKLALHTPTKIVESDTIILSDDINIILSKVSPWAIDPTVIQWRDSNCESGVSSVTDKTTVCMFIALPELAGRTLMLQTVEVDPFLDDVVGRLSTPVTLDESGKATLSHIVAWRYDGGIFGGDPEYRILVHDTRDTHTQTYKSSKLYVTKQAKPDVLQVSRGVAIDLLFDVESSGAEIPADLAFNPIIYPECQKDGIYSCRTWATPPSGNFMTVGAVHTASLARAPGAEPAPNLDPAVCDSLWSALEEKSHWIGAFTGGTILPTAVHSLMSGVEFTLLGAETAASLASAPHAILAALVGALAFEGGYWVGTELTGKSNCQAVIQRANELTNLTNTVQSAEFNPVKVCMATITGWKWEEPCQTMSDSYKPFDPLLPLNSLGQLDFVLKPVQSEAPDPSNEAISIVYYRNFDDQQDQSIKNSQVNTAFNPNTADIQLSGSLSNLQIAWSGGGISGVWLAEVNSAEFGSTDAHIFQIKSVSYHLSQNVVANDDYGNETANIVASPITYGDYNIVGAGPAHSNVKVPASALEAGKYYEVRMTRITPPASGVECQQGSCYEEARIAFKL